MDLAALLALPGLYAAFAKTVALSHEAFAVIFSPLPVESDTMSGRQTTADNRLDRHTRAPNLKLVSKTR
jgi:hypothetical protein